MRGAARAIAWEFGRHHRLPLTILVAYFAAFWAIKGWILGANVPIKFDPPNGLAGFVIAPMSIAFMFLVGVFSYGLSGDLGARESAFPRRMFTLPVATLALAGWPMLYGTLASVSMWMLTVLCAQATGRLDMELPWFWPALLLAAFLAWMQALTWLSYPLRGLRVVVAVLVLTAVDATVLIAIYAKVSESVMVEILAPMVAFAYVVGIWAVGRARRGEVADWKWIPVSTGSTSASETPAFRSPEYAQAWFEWRRHGKTLPAIVAFVVPCELALLFLPGNDRAGMIFFILFVALITPPAMAMLAAPAMSTLTTFAATRPLTSMALVAAKLRMTSWSTALTWLLTTVFTVVALVWSGAMPVVIEKLRDLAEIAGPLRATLLVVILFAALIASTWKGLVQSLCIGLAGNVWIVRSSVLLGLVALTAAFPILWIVVGNDRVQSIVWDYLPWLLIALVWSKVAIATAVAIGLHDRKVLSDRALVAGAVAWLVSVIAVYGVLRWIAASAIFPVYFLGAIAILLVPAGRLAAAPLALYASRHR